jgi:transcriptional regulator CtsR
LVISKIVTGYQHIIVDSFGVNWYYGNNKIYEKITITILKEVSMQRFQDEIESLYDIGTLTEKKNKIKDSVVNPELSWNTRMMLYQQIQLINVRIEKLSSQMAMH